MELGVGACLIQGYYKRNWKELRRGSSQRRPLCRRKVCPVSNMNPGSQKKKGKLHPSSLHGIHPSFKFAWLRVHFSAHHPTVCFPSRHGPLPEPVGRGCAGARRSVVRRALLPAGPATAGQGLRPLQKLLWNAFDSSSGHFFQRRLQALGPPSLLTSHSSF